MKWYEEVFIPTVAQRGAAIIQARGASSAASAANAAIEHIRDWALGTPEGDFVSMAVPSHGEYGIPEEIVYSFPVTAKDGVYRIVEGLEINEFARKRMEITAQELLDEMAQVKALGLI
jgi:malate dehydrogenase